MPVETTDASFLSLSKMFWHTSVLILSLYLRIVLAQSPKDIGQLFEVNGIVPDLIPEFDPIVLLQVSYGFTLVPGEILSQNGMECVIND